MNKAVFIDKDGTLIPDIPFNIDPARITLADDCLRGLRMLQDYGYALILVTNQPGIAYAYFTESELQAAFDKIEQLLFQNGIFLEGIKFCPHAPVTEQHPDGCFCRKPLPGLLYQAAEAFNINLAQSWMIGDILNDVEAGHRAGCRSVLIKNGNETEWLPGPFRHPDITVPTINDAAQLIIYLSGDGER